MAWIRNVAEEYCWSNMADCDLDSRHEYRVLLVPHNTPGHRSHFVLARKPCGSLNGSYYWTTGDEIAVRKNVLSAHAQIEGLLSMFKYILLLTWAKVHYAHIYVSDSFKRYGETKVVGC